MYQLYTDAATLNHSYSDQLISGGGILILSHGHQMQIKVPLTANDNHTAEFQICLAGFKELIKLIPDSQLKTSIVFYNTDSKIVADSLNKQYAKNYQSLVDQILFVQKQFQLVMNQWVPEAENMGAHQLAQQALHQIK